MAREMILAGVTRRSMAQVAEVVALGPGLGRVDLVGEGLGRDIAPGQFAMVEAPGRLDCVLLRPYSYFLAPSADRVAFLIKDVGKGTAALLTARAGDPVAVLGPLGTSFPTPPARCWVVAGGVGAAPFGACAAAPGLRILFGARSAHEAGFADALRALGGQVELATDDGSAGFAGSVVALLEHRLQSEKPDAVFCCGPTAMMAAVAAVVARHGVRAWVSLEERMGCGIGVCRGCAHPDARGLLRCICEDGPVYPAELIFAAKGAA